MEWKEMEYPELEGIHKDHWVQFSVRMLHPIQMLSIPKYELRHLRKKKNGKQFSYQQSALFVVGKDSYAFFVNPKPYYKLFWELLLTGFCHIIWFATVLGVTLRKHTKKKQNKLNLTLKLLFISPEVLFLYGKYFISYFIM